MAKVSRSLLEKLQKLRRCGKKIVFTNGCFDILHPGHIHILESARKFGDFLVVGLNSDESTRKLKGRGRPIFSESARRHQLLALKAVDEVVIFSEKTPLNLIKIIKPDILVKGADYKMDEVVGREIVESYGGKIVLVPILKDYSTSKIVDQLKKLFRMSSTLEN